MNKCAVSFAFGFYVCYGLWTYGFGSSEILGVSVCVLFGWLASCPAVCLAEWVGGRLGRMAKRIGKKTISWAEAEERMRNGMYDAEIRLENGEVVRVVALDRSEDELQALREDDMSYLLYTNGNYDDEYYEDDEEEEN